MTQPTPFKHPFGGWREADAIRRPNPDGSEGAIVAVGASVDAGVNLPSNVVVWPDASIGYGASIGDGASIGADDWFFALGPQGSRAAWATAVQSDSGLSWWVGCQHGIDTDTLKDRVRRDHAGTDHEADYLHAIRAVEDHPGRLRHIAARAATKTEEA